MTILPPSMKAALLFFPPPRRTLASLMPRRSITSSITSLTRAAPGKLATQTEIMAERGEPAMLTPSRSGPWMPPSPCMRTSTAAAAGPTLAKRLQKGDRSDDVVMLRQRLANEGYLPTESLAIETRRNSIAEVKEAVKAFQSNHGLAATGKVDDRTLAELNVPAPVRLETLRANRPRIAAYAEGLGPRYILVNIPSAQLEAVNFGSVYSRHNIVAGKIDRPSPALVSRVSEINFNPYWNVPTSIAARDLIPKLIKNPNALAEMNIRVFDGHDGPEVDPTATDWTTTPPDRYFFRQEPGAQNALGTVKINFPNPYNVYLHDTPAKELFGHNARYVSSGCIRVDQIHVLIDWIFSGQDGYDRGMIENIAVSGERFDQPVAQSARHPNHVPDRLGDR